MKQIAKEARFDFRGGINLSANQDTLEPHELLVCENARVLPSGSVQRRAGTSKIGAALGAAGRVRGVVEFAGTIVAIANGKLYHTPLATPGTWTEVTPGSGSLSTAVAADFAVYVKASDGSPLLFIASGGATFTWSGSVLTLISGTNSVPGAYSVRVYGDRVFYANGTRTLTWSKIGDGTVCTTGGISGGGAAVIGQEYTDNIIALETIGSSLLLASATGIARFTGTGSEIRIDSDTFGVTADIGPVGSTSSHSSAFRRIGDVGFMWTDRGPYLVTEGGISSLAEKLQTQGAGSSAVQWKLSRSEDAYVCDNAARNEAWFVYKREAGTTAVTVLVYNYVLQCWFGPFTMPAEIFSMANVKIAGENTLIGGCESGFVRKLDDPAESRDDDATDYTHTVRLAPMALMAGPHNTKHVRHVFVQTQTASGSAVPVIKVYPDGGAAVTAGLVSSNGAAGTPLNSRYDLAVAGKRFVVEWTGTYTSSSEGDLPELLGVIVQGSVMERW